MGHIKIAVASFDGATGSVGNGMKAFFTQVKATGAKIPDYQIIDAADADELRKKVRDGEYWGCVKATNNSTCCTRCVDAEKHFDITHNVASSSCDLYLMSCAAPCG